MQYFRNTSRCGIGRTDPNSKDMFPLCRYDRIPVSEAPKPSSKCGCQNPAPKTDCGCMPSASSKPFCGCEKTPTSENFGCTGLGMAFVPEQEFCELNEPEQALCRGSLFQKLDMPFYGTKGRGCK